MRGSGYDQFKGITGYLLWVTQRETLLRLVDSRSEMELVTPKFESHALPLRQSARYPVRLQSVQRRANQDELHAIKHKVAHSEKFSNAHFVSSRRRYFPPYTFVKFMTSDTLYTILLFKYLHSGMQSTVEEVGSYASRPYFCLELYLGGARRGCACEDVPLVAIFFFSS
jgi:hypothetical protein